MCEIYCLPPLLFLVPAPFSCTEDNQKMVLKSESGSLASYNYPLPYEGLNWCSWHFDLDTDVYDSIDLSFEFFDFPDCSRGDYVEIHNKRFCGSEIPPAQTLSPKDNVVFHSLPRRRTKNLGFKATYQANAKSRFMTFMAVYYEYSLTSLKHSRKENHTRKSFSDDVTQRKATRRAVRSGRSGEK